MRCCPHCGEELNYDDKVFLDGHGQAIGCEFCIEVKDAEDVEYALV